MAMLATLSSAAPGLIGLELVVPVLLELVRDGKLPLTRFIDALTRAPARIVGLEAPTLAEGSSADIVLVAPELEHRVDVGSLRSKSDNSPFVNRDYVGAVELTLVGGRTAFRRVP